LIIIAILARSGSEKSSASAAKGFDGGEKGLLALAASLEKPSEHPLAEAILERAKELSVPVSEVSGFEAVSGRGISAKLDGEACFAGNAAMMQEHGIDLGTLEEQGNALAQAGKTPLYFAKNGKAAGLVAVADVVKPTSRQAVEELKKMGIEVVMLTGDNQRTAEAIRQQTGIDRAVSDVLPQDKEQEIRTLQQQGKKVAMVGDGINDAPALARADVGIAIGAGTDVAMESADVVLMKSDLLDAVTAIQLSRSVIRNIRMNLFWAFFYNSIGIPLAAGVFYSILGWKLNPMFGAAAMSMSSVCVVTNALRLKLFRPTFTAVKAEEPAPAVVEAPIEAIEDTTDDEGDDVMKKIMIVEGMHCKHCQAAVEKALSAVEGVTEAKVDLEKKTATISMNTEVADDILMKAVADADFEPVSITLKKGLFGR